MLLKNIKWLMNNDLERKDFIFEVQDTTIKKYI